MVTFSLARISYMRSRGMTSPPRWTTFSISVTNCGCRGCSGSKWLNIGSINTGEMKITKTMKGMLKTHTQTHQRLGLFRMSQ